MTKPRDIVKRIAGAAKRQGLDFVLDREGANHTEGIYRECQEKLGKGWWRR